MTTKVHITNESKPKKAPMPTVATRAGRTVSTPRAGLVLVRFDRVKRKKDAKPKELASTLVKKVAKAMNKPGIAKRSVFTGKANVFAYSMSSADTSKVIRRDESGRLTVGRLVNGRFRAG